MCLKLRLKSFCLENNTLGVKSGTIEVFSSSYIRVSISQLRRNLKGQTRNLPGSLSWQVFLEVRWGEPFVLGGGDRSCADWGIQPQLSLSPADVPFWKLLNHRISWAFSCLFIERSQKLHFCLAGKAPCQAEGEALFLNMLLGKMIYFSASRKYSLFIYCISPLGWEGSLNVF